jgi:hypothetical protein
MESIPLWHRHELGERAVARDSNGCRAVALVGLVALARRTLVAGNIRIGCHPITDFVACHVLAHTGHHAAKLMAWDERIVPRIRP